MKNFIILISIAMIQVSIADENNALKLIKKLGQNLKKELKLGLKKGPAEAIKVCNTEALKITKKLNKDGIQLGRVSLKNRNPNNYPKGWMMDYIKKFHDRKIAQPYILVDLKDGKKGLLKPIKTAPVCLNCHGTQLSSPVQKLVKKLYPKDKATGYKTGDIRGFFWAIY